MKQLRKWSRNVVLASAVEMAAFRLLLGCFIANIRLLPRPGLARARLGSLCLWEKIARLCSQETGITGLPEPSTVKSAFLWCL